MNITEAILAIVKKGNGNDENKIIKLATVVAGSVSGAECDVVAFDDAATIPNVRIQANPDNGSLPVPADNSIVVIGQIAPFDYIILMYSSLSSIQFLDGSRGGLVDVVELVTRLNKIEDAFNTHTHSGVTVGGGVTGIPVPAIGIPLTDTVRGDIENINILQGNP